MRSKLLLGGLLASVMIVPALAQSNPPASPPTPPAPSATAPAPASVSQTGAWRSSKLIGLNVYNDQNEKLGDISEILLDKSGKVEGVVIGVGGFLGMGQHDIKVDMAKLKFVDEPVRTSATTTTTTTTGAANRPASATATTTTTTRSKWYPDHAVLSGVTKDQLKSHAAVQVRLSGVKSKKKPRFCRGFFFLCLRSIQQYPVMAAARSVFSEGNAGREPRSSARRTGTRRSGPSPWHSSLHGAT